MYVINNTHGHFIESTNWTKFHSQLPNNQKLNALFLHRYIYVEIIVYLQIKANTSYDLL